MAVSNFNTTVFVHSAVDSAADITLCSTDTVDCNLRSAWEYCGTVSSSSVATQHVCIIEIDAGLSISMDANLGALALGDTDYIDLKGGDASITSFTSDSTGTTDDGGSASTDDGIDFAPQFPVTTGGFISNTNFGNDPTNTPDPECVTAGVGDVLTFSTCGDFSGDPFIFLSTKSGQFLASNDDFCGLGSELTYTVDNIASGTAEYCLTMGCFSSASCSYTVTVDRLAASFNSGTGSSTIQTDLWPFQYSIGETFYFPSFFDDDYSGSSYTPTSSTDDDSGHTGGETGTFSSSFSTFARRLEEEVVEIEITNSNPNPDRLNMKVSQEAISRAEFAKKSRMLKYTHGAVSAAKAVHKAYREEMGFVDVGVGVDVQGTQQQITKDMARPPSAMGEQQQQQQQQQQGGRRLSLSDAPLYFIAHSESYVAAQGDFMTFSTVGFPNDEFQDTFLSLFFTESDNSLTLLQENDDFGGTLNSQITATATVAGTYVLRAGCAADAPGCYGFVQLSVLNATQVELLNAFDPRFIKYDSSVALADVSSLTTNMPLLNVSNLTISTFGSRSLSALGSAFNGGAFHLNGPASVDITNVKFASNTGLNGGHIYVSENTIGYVNVVECLFTGGTATNGGSVYIDNSVYGFSLIGSTITGSSATEGGAVYVNTLNHYVMLADTVISGGEANGNGGGLYLGTNNQFVRMEGTNITNCKTVAGEGGGIYLHIGNRFFTARNSSISFCAATNGAGVGINSGNDNVTFHQSVITSNTARSTGGGISLAADNFGLKVTKSTISSNVAVFGGGLGGANNNPGIIVAGSVVSNNTASSDGGGLYLVKNHSLFTSIDYDGYANRVVIQSPHPYTSGRPTNTTNGQGTPVNIISRSVNVPGCSTFVVIFNPRFDINEFDTITITNNEGTVLYDSAGFGIPGVSSPALTLNNVPNGQLEISFDGPAFTNLFVSTAPPLGFSMNIYPIMKLNSVAFGTETSEPFTLIEEEPIFDNMPFSTGVYDNATFSQLPDICIDACVGDTLRFAAEGLGSCVGDTTAVLSRNGGSGEFLRVVNNFCVQNVHYAIGTNSSDISSGCDAYCLSLGCGGNVAANNYQCKVTVGAYKGQETVRSFIPSHFIHNRATGGNGGAIMLRTQNPFGLVASTIVESNTAGVNGGGVMMKNSNNGAAFRNTEFVNNFAGQDGAGAMMSTAHSGVTFRDVTFDRNRADGNGGGISMNTDNGQGLLVAENNISFTLCSFTDNSANFGNGGAAYVSNDNEVFLLLTTLSGNRAPLGEGGGIFIDQNNKFDALMLDVEDNLANDNGGGFYLSRNSKAAMTFVAFRRNSATTGSGGGVFINSDNDVNFTNCIVSTNAAAIDGGGIAINEGNDIHVSDTDCRLNTAAFGGCAATASFNTIRLTSNVISGNNVTAMGGGLSIRSNTVVTFRGVNLFDGNEALGSGGGIASLQNPLWTVDRNESLLPSGGFPLTMRGNIAKRGSAFYLFAVKETPTDSPIIHTSFENNVAKVGGTVFWLKDATMFASPNGSDDFINNSFSGNSAPYGTTYATQGLTLSGPTDYNVVVYRQSLSPALVLRLSDFYGQDIPLVGNTHVAATIFDDNNSTQCLSNEPSIGGADTIGDGVTVNDGEVRFAKLTVVCSPTGNMTLNFEATIDAGTSDISNIADGAYNVNFKTDLHFRSCQKGEFTNNNAECETCALGSYSLTANASECRSCAGVAGVSKCEADQVQLQQGYWRRFPDTNAVLSCPLIPESCPGGNSSGQEACGVGYTGELCAVCDVGYFAQGTECFPCESKSILSPTLLIYFIIFAAIMLTAIVVIIVYYKFYKKADDEADHESVAHKRSVRHKTVKVDENGKIHTQIIVSYEDPVEESLEEPIDPNCLRGRIHRIYIWGKANKDSIMGKFKIAMSTYQIISVIGQDDGAEATEMPGAFQKMANMLKVVNLSIASIVPISCTETYTFIDSMYFATLMPVAVAAILVILGMWAYNSAATKIDLNPRSHPDAKKEAYADIRGKYMSYFLVLTYAVLPSVTTTIFKIFLCTDVDPENETPGDDALYLVADMRISCSSDYYYNGMAFAILMIFVYPIGIPLLYLYSLYYWQEDIKTRDDYIELTPELAAAAGGAVVNANGVEVEEKEKEEGNVTEDGVTDGAIVAADGANASANLGAGAAAASAVALTAAADGENSETPVLIKKSISAGAMRLNFLWKAYEPQFWYWEVIETTRRLMLTAILSVISPGTPAQTVVAILLAMMYMKVYDVMEPYDDVTDDIMANIGGYQVFFTFFGALVVKNGLLNQIWSETIGALLVMANLGIVVYLIYHRWDTIMAYIHNEPDPDGHVKTSRIPGELISTDGAAPVMVAEREAAKAKAQAQTEEDNQA